MQLIIPRVRLSPRSSSTGSMDIETKAAVVQEWVVSITYQKLKERGTLLEGTLLKPSITMAGVGCPKKPTLTYVAATDTAAVNSNNENMIVMIHYINNKN